MSLPPSRKPSAGQRRRSVATSIGRHSNSDANKTSTYPTNTYPGRAIEGSPTGRTYPGTPRRQTKHTTCSENHGIRPPTPEQYLTPLQQKEVCIRHLRARLRENVERLQHRDSEIAEMRNQLCRMQEDWIEEECHRVEAQLALKEARREIQHLHEVVETVRSNLGTPEKACHDQKPYLFPQGHRPAKSRSCGCSPASTLSRGTTYTRLSSDGLQLDRNGNAPGADLRTAARAEGMRTHLLLEAALLSEPNPTGSASGLSSSNVTHSSTYERLCSGGAVLPVSHSCHSLGNSCRCSGHTYLPHHHLFLHLPQEEPPAAVATATPVPVPEVKPEVRSRACSPTMTWVSEEGGGEELSIISLATTDITPAFSEHQPFPTSLSSPPPPQPIYSLEPLPPDGPVEMSTMPSVVQTCQPKPGTPPSPERLGGRTVAEEKENDEAVEGGIVVEGEEGSPQLNFWSRYFLVDLMAVAMPVVPTVAWLCHGAQRDVMPAYHIGSLLRGCCAVALHSLRRRNHGHGPRNMNGAANI
ncbi:syntaphilin [Esox lucius]|uniref:syntaphilin n=1 Tax=Esox lucius TaxID=8010 RepID=UPI0005763CED|nr:syntaphilin [Esox lucius]XP_028980190.1 syntaphilin [Esox lucius]XP_028980191.1 syntaphilin [Esox lucius]XP_028980192.1 syntaphilin [Esox lucius]XP_028980193.1 syntaphilin [Esox lucius]XP_028980194.1 syntaphilin [Esox lucius]